MTLHASVSELMACEIWKAKNTLNPLAVIFQKKPTMKNTCSAGSDKLIHPVPGYPQVASNKLAQVWNIEDVSSAKSLGSARISVRAWFKHNSTLLI